MPLSDDEQRILLEIEKEFYDSDPEFAREVGETTLYRHALRNIKWAVLLGVLGLIGMIAALQVHFVLAFAAFLVMFFSGDSINAMTLGGLALAIGIAIALPGIGIAIRWAVIGTIKTKASYFNSFIVLLGHRCQ